MKVRGENGNEEEIEEYVIVGDFGFFPRIADDSAGILEYNKYVQAKDTNDIPVRWIDGNHEDHELIEVMVNKGVKTHERYGAEHIRRGTYENRRLYIGGADSIDKHSRVQGIDWFPGENIKMRDYYTACENVDRWGHQTIDLLVTHEVPYSLLANIANWNSKDTPDGHSNRMILDDIYNRYKPKVVIHGHHHTPYIGTHKHDAVHSVLHVSLGNLDNRWAREYLSLTYDLSCMKDGTYNTAEMVTHQKTVLNNHVLPFATCAVLSNNSVGYLVGEDGVEIKFAQP